MVYTMNSEKKYTDEEIRAKVEESIRRAEEKLAAGLTPEEIMSEDRELTPDELESAAGGRTLTTGQVLTEEVVDQYAAFFKEMELTGDVLIIMSKELGFYPMDEAIVYHASRQYPGAHIDHWATKQKRNVCRENNPNPSELDKYIVV